MPLKKIQTQRRAYSVYSGLLFFPKREITKSGASSKIRKKRLPTDRTIFVIVFSLVYTLHISGSHVKADDWLTAGSIYIFGKLFHIAGVYGGLCLQAGRALFGLVLQLFSNTESASSLPEQPHIKRGDSFLLGQMSSFKFLLRG